LRVGDPLVLIKQEWGFADGTGVGIKSNDDGNHDGKIESDNVDSDDDDGNYDGDNDDNNDDSIGECEARLVCFLYWPFASIRMTEMLHLSFTTEPSQ